VGVILLLSACGENLPEWPSGAQSSVEGRWCREGCDDAALLTDELLLDWNGRQIRYLFVWTRETWMIETWPPAPGPVTRYHVGYFFERAPGEFHDSPSTHIPSDMTFADAPTFDDVVMARAQRMAISGELICGEVLHREWLRVVGTTVPDFAVMPCVVDDDEGHQ